MLPERYVGSQDKAAALIYFPSKMSSVGYKVHTLHQILEDEKWNLPIYQPEFQSARLQEAAGPHWCTETTELIARLTSLIAAKCSAVKGILFSIIRTKPT